MPWVNRNINNYNNRNNNNDQHRQQNARTIDDHFGFAHDLWRFWQHSKCYDIPLEFHRTHKPIKVNKHIYLQHPEYGSKCVESAKYKSWWKKCRINNSESYSKSKSFSRTFKTHAKCPAFDGCCCYFLMECIAIDKQRSINK